MANSYSKAPPCVIYFLMAFSVMLIILGGGLIWIITGIISRYQQIKELIDSTPTIDEIDEIIQIFLSNKEEIESRVKEITNQFELVKKNVSQKSMKLDNSFKELEENSSKIAGKLWSEIEATKDDVLHGYQNVSGECKIFLELYIEELESLRDFITERETIADGIELYMGRIQNDIQKIDRARAKDWIPESFTYLKMHRERDPKETWPEADWEEVTKDYSDCFLILDQSNYGEVKQPSFTGKDVTQNLRIKLVPAEQAKGAIGSKDALFIKKEREVGDSKLAIEFKGDEKNILPKLPSFPVRVYKKRGKAEAWEWMK